MTALFRERGYRVPERTAFQSNCARPFNSGVQATRSIPSRRVDKHTPVTRRSRSCTVEWKRWQALGDRPRSDRWLLAREQLPFELSSGWFSRASVLRIDPIIRILFRARGHSVRNLICVPRTMRPREYQGPLARDPPRVVTISMYNLKSKPEGEKVEGSVKDSRGRLSQVGSGEWKGVRAEEKAPLGFFSVSETSSLERRNRGHRVAVPTNERTALIIPAERFPASGIVSARGPLRRRIDRDNEKNGLLAAISSETELDRGTCLTIGSSADLNWHSGCVTGSL